jgi:hypothetical protein
MLKRCLLIIDSLYRINATVFRATIKYFQVEFTVGLSLREQSFIYLFRSLIVGLSGLPGLSGLSRLSRLSGLPRLSRLSRLSRSSGLSGLSGLSDRRDHRDRHDRRDRQDRPTIRICEAIVLQLLITIML